MERYEDCFRAREGEERNDAFQLRTSLIIEKKEGEFDGMRIIIIYWY